MVNKDVYLLHRVAWGKVTSYEYGWLQYDVQLLLLWSTLHAPVNHGTWTQRRSYCYWVKGSMTVARGRWSGIDRLQELTISWRILRDWFNWVLHDVSYDFCIDTASSSSSSSSSSSVFMRLFVLLDGVSRLMAIQTIGLQQLYSPCISDRRRC